ncbi:ChbG/HpnK family deacetylase [Chelatococcus sp. SYSU_G07232]|uniref:ChbG/HpnK family deacetylase n=1 Tax=Chelatococcus albus TaxID=3047466 RepID=A0ABT7AJ57_9HYPH|nr:ChbG/HpnK family deacetylase [Chelatococcus sp. SYSU_G07232]MDJ1159408.1 ChbG/HpnK family deacetylase [Chelatococcus sp. SYSU_G07232]
MLAARHPFVLCADDFALTPGVSRAILALAEAGRLTATGAMTNRSHWPDFAPALKALDGRIAAGVHVNLTLGAPLGPMPRLAPAGMLPPFGRLARLAFTGGLPKAEIEAEIARQLDAFEEAFGRPPDFVDGHQHVQVLPGVRGALLAVLARRGLAGCLWLRNSGDRPAAIVRRGIALRKALVIAGLATGFAAAARRAGFATNAGFAGVSAFDPHRDFGADFARFLVAPGARHLVMCHPGEAEDAELAAIDPVVETRPQEFAFLRSGRFPDLCAAAGAGIVRRWPEAPAAAGGETFEG